MSHNIPLAERRTQVDSHVSWIDKVSFASLFAAYLAVMITAPIVGAIAFFFPIYPIYSLLGWEFSNLGPIATFFWGVLFDVFIATPCFLGALLIKLARHR